VRGVRSSNHCEPVFGEAIPDHAVWGLLRRQNRSSQGQDGRSYAT